MAEIASTIIVTGGLVTPPQSPYGKAFTFLLIHCNYLLPSAYLDLLHRCALHLGCWQEQSPSSHSGYLNWHAWSLLQTYPKGIHVKHVRGLFESVGGSNAAEPGNSTHFRFYYWFSSPLTVMNALCYIAVTVSLSQLFALENGADLDLEWGRFLLLLLMSPPLKTPPIQATNAVNAIKS
ncbi:unnamed protein product [Rodentolepis nana]|uniref:GPI mannosyltransferase 2 n=1 Tax=Rodentolepis nana TaxID=102285 RepID=A0A0R3TMJ8_RODNA|nr:unnamed protein product [Rodentolepis nana]